MDTHERINLLKNESRMAGPGPVTRRIGLVAILFLLAFAVMPIFSSSEVDAGGRPFSTTLTGAAEVPGPGDPDGTGTAELTLNQGQGEVCFELEVTNIAQATGAHIHVGSVEVAGPIVVTLVPPTNGSSSGCATGVSRDLIKDIRQNPSNYYVNVHNADFPAGAVRGQLSK